MMDRLRPTADTTGMPREEEPATDVLTSQEAVVYRQTQTAPRANKYRGVNDFAEARSMRSRHGHAALWAVRHMLGKSPAKPALHAGGAFEGPRDVFDVKPTILQSVECRASSELLKNQVNAGLSLWTVRVYQSVGDLSTAICVNTSSPRWDSPPAFPQATAS
jgi:hypothetical protein